MGRFLLLVALLGTPACANGGGTYFYRPADQAIATIGGRLAARYAIPPESPRGSARVASLGITNVNTPRGELRALHLRLVLANFDDTDPWEFDVRTLQVSYEGGYLVRPSFVNTNVSDTPVVSIPARGAARIDAYFRLPPRVEGPSDVPEFDLLWEVRTPERTVAQRTPFDRITIEDDAE